MSKKYEHIIADLEQLISKKFWRQGERLPSIRVLAEKYHCNKATVIRAYQELEWQHKVYSIPKGGFYLVEKGPSEEEDYNKLDFSEVLPDPKLLPYKEFNHCINRAVELYKDILFTYGDVQGLESLRRVLAKSFSEQQVFTSADNIFITSGAQQALSILVKMTFPNNKRSILVEQPTYGLLQRMAELNGIRLVGIPRDGEGIELKQLERIFKEEDIKFFYTIPRFHNPLGTSFTEKTKKEIVRLAEKYNVYIVEDDYLADINGDGRSLPIHYYDTAGKTVYVKSFSKAFMPGIRIGAVVLPESMSEEFASYKRCDDLNTSVLAQGALEIFINSGMLHKHIQKTKGFYRRRMDFLRAYSRNLDLSGATLFIPETGLFLWVNLPDSINPHVLKCRLKEKNIGISAGSDFYIEQKSGDNAFRMCISRLEREQIQKGMEMIFEEIQSLHK